MKFSIVFIFFFISVAVLSQASSSSYDTTNVESLEEVVVTATRTIRQLSSLPLPVQLISKREIENTNVSRLGDILNEQTGLITIPDFGGVEGIQMQGLDAQYTLVLIDGVPIVGRSAGTLDLNRITVGNIKQIEVVKGASSSLYGSEALGGVINIITDDPSFGRTIDIMHRYRSFQSHDSNFTIGYKNETLSISSFLNRYSSEGYDLIPTDELMTKDPFYAYTSATKIKYKMSQNTNLSLTGRFYRQKQENTMSASISGKGVLNEWNTRLKLDHKFTEKWEGYVDLYSSLYETKEYLNNKDGYSFNQSAFSQYLFLPELRTSYTLNTNHEFVGGIGWRHETLDRTYFSEVPKFNSQYIYVQYDGDYAEKLNVIIGARFDRHSEYRSQMSPKLAIRYQLFNKFAIKASIGYGFKAPDFRQLYFDFTNAAVGYTVLGYQVAPTRLPELEAQGLLTDISVPVSAFNQDLKPENSISYNIGFQYTPTKALSLSANFFRNNIKDLIDIRVIARRTNGQNVFSYYNLDKVYTTGIESDISYRVSDNIILSGGYQLLYAKDIETEKAFKNNEVFARDPNTLQTFVLDKDDYFGLYNRSRHMANAKVFYTIPQWGVNTNVRFTYRSKYGLSDSNNNAHLDHYDEFASAYTLWNWAINKKIYNHYEIGFGVENILDYTDPLNNSNQPGRTFYGTFNIHF